MALPSDTAELQAEALDSPEAGARFIRGSAVRLIAFGASLLTSIVSAPLVIRHLGPVDYGYFATVNAIVFIIGGFTEGGLNTLGIREFASGRQDRARLLRNLIGLRVTATATALVVSAIIAAAIGAPSVIAYGILIAGAGLIVTITGENYGIPLSADLRITAVSILGLAQQIALATCYIVLVIVGARTLPLLASTIVSGSVLLAGTAVLVRGEVSLVPAFDRREWAALIRQTLPYAMATAVGIIYFREALVLSSALTTARQVSYYSAAFRIVEVLTAVPWLLVTAAFPIFSRAAYKDDAARLQYALQRVFDTLLLAGVWVAGSLIVGATFAIAVVAGPKFKPSVGVLQIQSLALVATFMVALFGSMLLSLRAFRPLLWANLLAVGVATALCFALIPDHGARGAAIAPAAAEGCLAIAYWWGLRRARPNLRLSLGVVPRLVLATALSLGIAFALPISSAAALFVFSGLYIGSLWLLRAIPFEIVNAILRRRPPPV
jgi:O-antigen/teichoic acid export membrane protein